MSSQTLEAVYKCVPIFHRKVKILSVLTFIHSLRHHNVQPGITSDDWK